MESSSATTTDGRKCLSGLLIHNETEFEFHSFFVTKNGWDRFIIRIHNNQINEKKQWLRFVYDLFKEESADLIPKVRLLSNVITFQELDNILYGFEKDRVFIPNEKADIKYDGYDIHGVVTKRFPCLTFWRHEKSQKRAKQTGKAVKRRKKKRCGYKYGLKGRWEPKKRICKYIHKMPSSTLARATLFIDLAQRINDEPSVEKTEKQNVKGDKVKCTFLYQLPLFKGEKAFNEHRYKFVCEKVTETSQDLSIQLPEVPPVVPTSQCRSKDDLGSNSKNEDCILECVYGNDNTHEFQVMDYTSSSDVCNNVTAEIQPEIFSPQSPTFLGMEPFNWNRVSVPQSPTSFLGSWNQTDELNYRLGLDSANLDPQVLHL